MLNMLLCYFVLNPVDVIIQKQREITDTLKHRVVYKSRDTRVNLSLLVTLNY